MLISWPFKSHWRRKNVLRYGCVTHVSGAKDSFTLNLYWCNNFQLSERIPFSSRRRFDKSFWFFFNYLHLFQFSASKLSLALSWKHRKLWQLLDTRRSFEISRFFFNAENWTEDKNQPSDTWPFLISFFNQERGKRKCCETQNYHSPNPAKSWKL